VKILMLKRSMLSSCKDCVAALSLVALSVVFIASSTRGIPREALHSLATQDVDVFHLIDNSLWGEADGSFLQGEFDCTKPAAETFKCNVFSSDRPNNYLNILSDKFKNASHRKFETRKPLTVALYNIHTWVVLSPAPHYPSCLLPTDFSMVESEESHKRFKDLFTLSFKNYHGNSTTSPFSSVQRSYISGLNESSLLPQLPFSESILGASFVASACHKGSATTNRMQVVMELQKIFRVDSLGACMKTKNRAIEVLRMGSSAQETLILKQHAISKYLFYLAFENSKEPGYVTEKFMDGLVAGTVPVYMGDSATCKKLLPHPKAVIFFDDFNSTSDLGEYLIYLSRNESAYEEHRAWRKDFKFEKPISQSVKWACEVCNWALRTQQELKMERRKPKTLKCN
jgi:Glycosyltransferase family 10 (fucosyltransferase) C-term